MLFIPWSIDYGPWTHYSMNELEQYYFQQEEPFKSLFFALRDIILSWDNQIIECLKYGSPCYLYRGKIMCYHFKDKSGQAYVLFNNGKELNHPLLETKGRKLMKSVDVFPDQDIPYEGLTKIFLQAKTFIDSKLD